MNIFNFYSQSIEEIKDEAEMNTKLHHPHVVKYMGAWVVVPNEKLM